LSKFPFVRFLDLSSTPSHSMPAVCAHSFVHHIDAAAYVGAGAGVGKAGALPLAQALELCTNLVSLNLAGNALKAACSPVLAALPPSLTALDLSSGHTPGTNMLHMGVVSRRSPQPDLQLFVLFDRLREGNHSIRGRSQFQAACRVHAASLEVVGIAARVRYVCACVKASPPFPASRLWMLRRTARAGVRYVLDFGQRHEPSWNVFVEAIRCHQSLTELSIACTCGRVLSRRRDRLWSCLRGVVAPAHLLSHDQATQLLSAMVSCPALVGLHFTGRSGTMACPAFACLIAVHG